MASSSKSPSSKSADAENQPLNTFQQDKSGVPEVSIEVCSASTLPGVSIGIHNSSAGSSTLGEAIQLRDYRDSEWRTLYLTCFHCVFPPPQHRESLIQIHGAKQGLDRWEDKPANFHDPQIREVLRVDHPSRRDLEAAIATDKSTIQQRKTPAYQRMESRIKAEEAGEDVFVEPRERQRYEKILKPIEMFQERLDKSESFWHKKLYYLGRVIAGSGLHRTKERFIDGGRTGVETMDWALISALKTREGLNKPFPYTERAKLLNITYYQASDVQPELDMELHKSGRSTQCTQGRYNGAISAAIARTEDSNICWVSMTTYEHAVARTGNKPFAKPGDSGSWIFTPQGEVVGMMLYGACERLNIVYFMHIDDILQDIKDVTHAFDVRIAE
ncbi:hypothetical protein ASPACDRAFT_55914 [Aspergillus aculeatus ATCC 16872]|uniref:Peptidase S1 domain-containing protein n=1 Tax=Aspergillus aculeatus (strain ATCC 16872 / CBS 172.66 / WB 5094) TaxID=690307 RepID=A0A1L9X7K9_ASPA1|nr:uncharacterized protein ASPACDRAFT_55914 [Aspergillus aculeatus ATCC 16872]OJK04433.1 hypothetical protein ASPACDRAFT_55914 [Aspergillus aculeatus ATCC 16872]